MISVTSAQLVASNVLRVTFSKMPLMTPSGNFTARNKFSYLLMGAEEVSIESVKPASADPFSVDIKLSRIPSVGTWTLKTTGVQTVDGEGLDGTVLTEFVSDGTLGLSNPGANAETAEDRFRKFLNPGLVGEEWDAICAALGYSDRITEDIAAAGLQQNFFLRAQGVYLERLSAGIGVERPAKTGMTDATLGQLAADVNANKLTDVAIRDVLKAYYGEDSVRSAIDTENVEPYVLADGQFQLFNVDGVDFRIDFETDDFTNIAQARAHEIAAVINRKLFAFNLPGLAIAAKLGGTTDIILRMYSGRLGQQGFVSARGGSAQLGLNFPRRLLTTVDAGSVWDLATGSSPSTARLTWVSGTDPTLSEVEVDDILCLFGTPFLSSNRGTFVVTAVSNEWVEFSKPATFTQQLSVNLAADEDIVFWRPVVGRLQGYFPNVVSDGVGGVKVVLPATSTAISRTPDSGWYLHGNEFLPIGDADRDANGLVTVSVPEPHGLSVDDVINLQNWVPNVTYGNGSASETPPWYTGPSGPQWLTAIKLTDGRVMAISSDASDQLAWIFDPDAAPVSAWSALADPPDDLASLMNGGGMHRLVQLQDGRVLMLSDSINGDFALYNPDTDAWVLSNSAVLGSIGYAPTMIMSLGLLSTGHVVALAPNGMAATYDPIANVWTVINATPMFTPNTTFPTWQHALYIDSDDRAYILAPNTINGTSNLLMCDTLGRYCQELPIIWVGEDDEGDTTGDSPLLFVPIGPRGQLMYVTYASGGVARLVAFDLSTEESFEARSISGDANEFNTFITDLCTMIQLADGRFLIFGGESGIPYTPDTPSHFVDLVRGPISTVLENNFQLTSYNLNDDYFGSNHNIVIRLNDDSVLVFGGTMGPTNLDEPYPVWLRMYFDPDVTSGLVPNDVRVTEVLSATAFTFETVCKSIGAWSVGEYAPTTSADNFKSGFMLDTKGGVTITSTRTTLTAPITRGPSTNLIAVASAASFPDLPGYIVFNYGFKNQVGPIEYLGSNGTNTLRLAPGQDIQAAQAIGATVTLLLNRGVFSPDPSKGYGVTWLTASAAGRIECQNDVEFIAASGSKYDFEILYPGDRGLGNAGQPDAGAQKLSDRVWIWGGDTLDAELEAARENDV